MNRIAGRFLAAIVMAAPLLCAAPAHAGGAGNCGGSVLGLAGTETCGAYKNDASDVTNPNDLHGFTVSSGGDLVFRNGVGLSGLEHMRLTATGSLGLGTATPKASVDLSAKTDGLLLQTASAAANAVCTSSMTGAVRYNSNLTNIEFCNGSVWSRVVLSTCDNVSTPLVLGDLNNLVPSTLTTSSIVLVTGMDSGCTVTVGVSGTGGSPQYRVCSDSGCSSVVQNWTNANNVIDIQGKYIQLRATSSASVSTAFAITVAVGPVSSVWNISTGLSSCTPVGTACSDGTVYAGLSGASTPMYVTRCDLGMTWNGSSCTGARGTYSWNNGNNTGYTTTSTGYADGQANTATLVAADSDSSIAGTQQHQAAQACKNLTDSGHSDWYLPARSEMYTIYANYSTIGNFTTGNVYWTSTEANSNGAYEIWLYSGAITSDLKGSAYYVRCARR